MGVVFYSSFVVPELPVVFDAKKKCYYDYLNIFWRGNPPGGYMNQFVPQLMLGNALANSTNYPDFKPHWLQLGSWHVGAQYFMGLCPDGKSTDCKADWIARAATGELIPVEPGERIETMFRLVPSRKNLVWELSIGVQNQPERTSVLVVDKPFMGLLSRISAREARDWSDELYDLVYVGSCLENYGMEQRENFPTTWEMEIGVSAPTQTPMKGWQHEWSVNHFHRCNSWDPPLTQVQSWNSSSNAQKVFWTANTGQVADSTG